MRDSKDFFLRNHCKFVHCVPEATGVTFSDSYSAPLSKFLNPDPKIFQIWESKSSSISGNRRWNRNSAIQ